jgi:DNA-binding NarL/FixJ family response regulator
MPHKKSAIRVLIAERAMSVADAIARNLRSEDCMITGIATTCEQTLEAATMTVPDVVFLDIALPGEMDSFTVGQKIVQDLNCPVVYMSTSNHPRAIAQIHHTNPSGCLIKPFTVDALKFALNQALRHHQLGKAMQENGLPADHTWDMEPFLRFLSAASSIHPMPRVVFEDEILKLYTGKFESACYLTALCMEQDYPYQIFLWEPLDGTFQLFDESDESYTDLQDLM